MEKPRKVISNPENLTKAFSKIVQNGEHTCVTNCVLCLGRKEDQVVEGGLSAGTEANS